MADPRITARLKRMPVFADLRPKELALLTMVMHEVRASPGEEIVTEGAEGDSCYFVLSGEVGVYKNAGGSERYVATLGENQLFGQIALVDAGPRSATCRAMSAVHLLRLSNEDFEMLFNSGSHFAFRFQALIAHTAVEQLRKANERLGELATSRDARASDSGSLEEIQAILARSDTTT